MNEDKKSISNIDSDSKRDHDRLVVDFTSEINVGCEPAIEVKQIEEEEDEAEDEGSSKMKKM
jgi:hypothetical protein